MHFYGSQIAHGFFLLKCKWDCKEYVDKMKFCSGGFVMCTLYTQPIIGSSVTWYK